VNGIAFDLAATLVAISITALVVGGLFAYYVARDYRDARAPHVCFTDESQCTDCAPFASYAIARDWHDALSAIGAHDARQVRLINAQRPAVINRATVDAVTDRARGFVATCPATNCAPCDRVAASHGMLRGSFA